MPTYSKGYNLYFCRVLHGKTQRFSISRRSLLEHLMWVKFEAFLIPALSLSGKLVDKRERFEKKVNFKAFKIFSFL